VTGGTTNRSIHPGHKCMYLVVAQVSQPYIRTDIYVHLIILYLKPSARLKESKCEINAFLAFILFY